MDKNYKITIEYDGTSWHGWQKQKNNPTIQEEIEKTLFRITRENITIHGSGRTDAGVHALGQTASFQSSTKIPSEALLKGLNCLLSDTIVIKECKIMDNAFHARFSALNKTYRYNILNRKLPLSIGRQYSWHINKKLDIQAMNQACTYIVGKKDFKSFESSGSPRNNTVRDVTQAIVSDLGNDNIIFETNANGYLKNMVRNMVGTIVDVGLGKIKPEKIQDILCALDRRKAGKLAPAKGLFLMHVNY